MIPRGGLDRFLPWSERCSKGAPETGSPRLMRGPSSPPWCTPHHRPSAPRLSLEPSPQRTAHFFSARLKTPAEIFVTTPATPVPSCCASHLDQNCTFPKLPFPSSLCSAKSSMAYLGVWSFLGMAYTGSASVPVIDIETSVGPSQETPCNSEGNLVRQQEGRRIRHNCWG